ncbi:MAG: NUDIX domain-containing protein [Candidatus Caldarchaeum sp.]|uniref:NUDIX domain-containing protein n=1 Tax=Caldiarchaeum subterraneum TaxID=311458 RepID=A0A7C5Q6Q2_CALS0
MKLKIPELTVGAFIVARDGDLLLVVSPKWGYLFSIPGGHVLYGESVFDAVVREAREEVGVDIKPVRVIAFQEVCNPPQFHDRKRHFIFVDVLCKALSKKVKVDGQEIVAYTWVRPSKALQLPLETYTERLIRYYLRGGRVTSPSFFPAAFRQ